MSLEEFTMKRVRRQFTVEFKKNAVSLVVDENRSISEVANSLNISSKTLSTWLRQSKEGKLEGKIASNFDDKNMQMAAVMAENQRLKAEVLLLKNSQRIFQKTGFSKVRFYC
ncbi:MAG TPA: transposase [Candidatus Aphodousia faecipullorum]|nr:transposase [Candidatus Aphodousia faecipullorum]